MTFFSYLDSHTGLVAGVLVLFVLLVLYLRGQATGFWPFLRDTLSEREPSTGAMTPSTKRLSLLVSLWAVLWAFAKITLAVCRWIDKGNDPTTIYITLALGVLGLAGSTYLGGKWLSGKNPITPGTAPNLEEK